MNKTTWILIIAGIIAICYGIYKYSSKPIPTIPATQTLINQSYRYLTIVQSLFFMLFFLIFTGKNY